MVGRTLVKRTVLLNTALLASKLNLIILSMTDTYEDGSETRRSSGPIVNVLDGTLVNNMGNEYRLERNTDYERHMRYIRSKLKE